MDSHTPVEIDQKELERTAKEWASFAKLMTKACIATGVILALMAIFLL